MATANKPRRAPLVALALAIAAAGCSGGGGNPGPGGVSEAEAAALNEAAELRDMNSLSADPVPDPAN